VRGVLDREVPIGIEPRMEVLQFSEGFCGRLRPVLSGHPAATWARLALPRLPAAMRVFPANVPTIFPRQASIRTRPPDVANRPLLDAFRALRCSRDSPDWVRPPLQLPGKPEQGYATQRGCPVIRVLRFLGLLLSALALPLASGKSQQQFSRDADARRQIDSALAPLRTLSPVQMHAAAALVVASRAGFEVEQYCPPLKQFAAPERVRCLGEISTYATEVKKCKKANPTWKDCPKVIEAEAAWGTCESAYVRRLVQEIRRLGPPQPGPGPGSAPPTR